MREESSEARDLVHVEPLWREKADFIIGASVEEGGAEQLWARRLGERRFEICCIPFFVYDLALADVVETDENYEVTRVAQASGRYVFRVWFGDSTHPKQEIVDGLTELDALLEWSSENLLAVDAVDEAHARHVADFLAEHERAAHLDYETGRR